MHCHLHGPQIWVTAGPTSSTVSCISRPLQLYLCLQGCRHSRGVQRTLQQQRGRAGVGDVQGTRERCWSVLAGVVTRLCAELHVAWCNTHIPQGPCGESRGPAPRTFSVYH